MRRQARISAGGALVMRSASALQVWLWLLIFVFQNEFRIARAIQPGYLDFDNLPETNFTCAGKVIGGYYADVETSCQMFHVCTVGAENETMDIKFLCLNGTVFDQETRVCERVDEVDCSKTEKFYSLNLELYGSTAPPIIQPEQVKPQPKPTEDKQRQANPNHEVSDPSLDGSPTTKLDKVTDHSLEAIDSTEDPSQDVRQEEHSETINHTLHASENNEPIEVVQDEEEDDSEVAEYEDDYTHYSSTTTTTTTTSQASIPTTSSTTTTTAKPQTTTQRSTITLQSSIIISSPAPSSTSYSSPISPSIPSSATLPTFDPSVLSPEEFTYHHRGPGSEAISFQRQSFRPADGIYITHAPPSNNFEQYEYESSRTVPRPVVQRPAPFMQRPHPQPFRATTTDPHDQILRPSPISQSSNRIQTTNRLLPQKQNTPFDLYYYDKKRSANDPVVDRAVENESVLTARSVPPPVITERRPYKPKSPPRVIVTASASVSDSNGRRLNYTVGNVVSAVKPIAQINYDNYQESDFDPFFLDVPRIQKRRRTRSNKAKRIFIVPSAATTLANDLVTLMSTTAIPVTSSRIKYSEKSSPQMLESIAPTELTTKSTAAWNPDDYVDDNYEPHIIPPSHPLAILMPYQSKTYKKEGRKIVNMLSMDDISKDQNFVNEHLDKLSPTSFVRLHASSSQNVLAANAALLTAPALTSSNRPQGVKLTA